MRKNNYVQPLAEMVKVEMVQMIADSDEKIVPGKPGQPAGSRSEDRTWDEE